MLTKAELDQLPPDERAKEAVYGWKPWRLRVLRERKGWSQEDLMKYAVAVGIDKSRATFGSWEGGDTAPPSNILPVLAKLLTGSEDTGVFYDAGSESRRETGKVEGRQGKGAPRGSGT